MSDIESRLKTLEDRAELQNNFIAYLAIVDSMSDIGGLLECFTENVAFDLRGLNLPQFDGHAGIKKFFTEGFAEMAHLAHFVTNFYVIQLEDDKADCRASVITTWETLSGLEGLAYVQCEFSCVRARQRWKIDAFVEKTLMPLIPRSTAQVSAQHARTTEQQS
jgi:hypothetical protein